MLYRDRLPYHNTNFTLKPSASRAGSRDRCKSLLHLNPCWTAELRALATFSFEMDLTTSAGGARGVLFVIANHRCILLNGPHVS